MRLVESIDKVRAGAAAAAAEAHHPERVERVSAAVGDGGVHVAFYGDWCGAAYHGILEAILAAPGELLSLTLDGPDEGANGTKNWDLTPLLSAPRYPALTHLHIARGRPEDHNRSSVAAYFDEDGVLGALAARAPRLESLTAPSAPAPNLFETVHPALWRLDLDAGYDAQGFIEAMTLRGHRAFPALRALAWGEYCETYLAHWRDETTPFETMAGLFGAPALAQATIVTLRNPLYSEDELGRLKALLPKASLKIVRALSSYV